MNILFFDTSTNICSVGLIISPENIKIFTSQADKQQSFIILPAIQKLLEAQSISFQNINAIAFTNGPGSFTGIRLSNSIAQGLAFSHNLPVIAISTLQALAQSAFEEQRMDKALVAIDAFADSIYFGAYQNNSGIMMPCQTDQRCAIEEFKFNNEVNLVGVGNAWEKYSVQLANKPGTIFPGCKINATALATLAMHQYVNQQYCSIEKVEPNYLYDADCWKK